MADNRLPPFNNASRVPFSPSGPSVNDHAQRAAASTRASRNPLHHLPRSADDVFAAFDTMSRRIDDLARELNCLGYFPDDDHRPRAA